jgi:hypothetical protein
MLIICAYCNQEANLPNGAVNRARKRGLNIYCNRKCARLGRWSGKSIDEKRQLKSEYDKEYRAKNLEIIKAKKRDYFQRTYDAEQAAIERKKNMARHVEYCRKPEYKAKKKEYDQAYKTKQRYGEFWESVIILNEIEKVVDSREAFQINRLYEKQTTRRKRKWRQKLITITRGLRLKI